MKLKTIMQYYGKENLLRLFRHRHTIVPCCFFTITTILEDKCLIFTEVFDNQVVLTISLEGKLEIYAASGNLKIFPKNFEIDLKMTSHLLYVPVDIPF